MLIFLMISKLVMVFDENLYVMMGFLSELVKENFRMLLGFNFCVGVIFFWEIVDVYLYNMLLEVLFLMV